MRHKIFVFNIYLLLLIIIIPACQNNSTRTNAEQLKKSIHLDSLLVQWQSDSLGCNRFRNREVAEKIFIKYQLMAIKLDSAFLILGKPNEFSRETKTTYGEIIYYCNSLCSGNKLKMNSDKQWISFLIKRNKIVEFRLVMN